MSGINVINIYAFDILTEIQKAGGESAITPKVGTYLIGLCGVIGSLLSKFTINYFKRRTLLLSGHAAMGICLIFVAIFVDLNLPTLCFAFMSLFVLSFYLSSGPMIFIYIAEVAND